MATTAERDKQGLLTGIGDGYFQIMTTEESPSQAPVYQDKVKIVPSLDKLKCKLEFKSKTVYLSSKAHTTLGRASKATITLDAGYLPKGFVEEVLGSPKLAEGVYGMGGTGETKFFRFAFPILDENDTEIIINFPKCQLTPVDLNSETQGEEKKEQMQQYDIIAFPLNTNKSEEEQIYYKADLRDAKDLDREKLLTNGFYNKTTLETAKVTKGASTISSVNTGH